MSSKFQISISCPKGCGLQSRIKFKKLHKYPFASYCKDPLDCLQRSCMWNKSHCFLRNVFKVCSLRSTILWCCVPLNHLQHDAKMTSIWWILVLLQYTNCSYFSLF